MARSTRSAKLRAALAAAEPAPPSPLSLLELLVNEEFDAVVEVLAEPRAGVDVNEADGDGLTLLILASCAGQAVLAARLIELGADVTIASADGSTALLVAAEGGHLCVMDVLGAAGVLATPDTSDSSNQTSIFLAASFGHEAVVQRLIEAGANVNAADCDGVTPLMAAAAGGYLDIVQLLLENGGDAKAQDHEGKTVLMHAVESLNEGLFHFLLTSGVTGDLDIEDADGCTAMACALDNHQPAMALGLLEMGADPGAGARAIPSVTAQAVQLGDQRLVEQLISKGACDDLDASVNGCSLLKLAVEGGNIECVRALVKAGASADSITSGDTSLLIDVAADGTTDMIACLFECGLAGDIDQVHYEETALLLAAKNGHAAAVQLLLDLGASSVIECSRPRPGSTREWQCRDCLLDYRDRESAASKIELPDALPIPLVEAARAGHVEVISVLLSHPSIATLLSVDKQAALRAAAENHHFKAVLQLVEVEDALPQLSIPTQRGKVQFMLPPLRFPHGGSRWASLSPLCGLFSRYGCAYAESSLGSRSIPATADPAKMALIRTEALNALIRVANPGVDDSGKTEVSAALECAISNLSGVLKWLGAPAMGSLILAGAEPGEELMEALAPKADHETDTSEMYEEEFPGPVIDEIRRALSWRRRRVMVLWWSGLASLREAAAINGAWDIVPREAARGTSSLDDPELCNLGGRIGRDYTVMQDIAAERGSDPAFITLAEDVGEFAACACSITVAEIPDDGLGEDLVAALLGAARAKRRLASLCGLAAARGAVRGGGPRQGLVLVALGRVCSQSRLTSDQAVQAIDAAVLSSSDAAASFGKDVLQHLAAIQSLLSTA